jgi:hypothetical protein
MLDHLEALLLESGCGMQRLWHLAGAPPHTPWRVFEFLVEEGHMCTDLTV